MKQYDFEDEPLEERPTFEQALQALQQGSEPEDDAVLVYGLSDLTDEQIESLMPVWRGLDADYRHLILQMLTDEIQSNYELSYDQLALQGLADSDERIRRTSIELLITSEDPNHIRLLLHHAAQDGAILVRMDALRGIAAFCRDGAYESLSQTQVRQIQALAQARVGAEVESEERGAALELLAAIDAASVQLIRDAYHSGDSGMKASALVAMGYTADADEWREIVLHELEEGNPYAVREAIRASGALELTEAVPVLARLLNDEEIDARETIVWSLGEIGGKESMRILNALAEAAEEDEDDDLLDKIEDALANASLADGSDFFNVLS
jgi:HEAT repeat protein